MTIALWLIGILAVLFTALGSWLYKTCENTDGDLGQAIAGSLFVGIAMILVILWVVLQLCFR